MKKLFVVAIFLASFSGCENWEYYEGRSKGQQDVREARKEMGWVGEVGVQAIDDFGAYPTDKSKSADWNAGYREGMKNEINK